MELKELKSDTFSISLEFENGILANCSISAGALRPNLFEFDYWLTSGSIINNTKVFGKKKIYFRKQICKIFESLNL